MPFVQGFLDADGARLHYQQAGSGQALIHIPGGGLQISRAHEMLSERHRVIALAPPASSSALDALGIERYALWGTAAGAGLALQVALEHPEVVDGLVLESPELEPADHVRLSELESLTLVLFGTEDPAGHMGSVYKEHIKRCFLVLVYGAGQDIVGDRPAAFAEMVGDFLERQERFIVSATPSVLEP